MAKLGSLAARWLALAGLVVAAMHGSAFAQSYPTKPVMISVGFGPGGPMDIVTRILAQPLGALLGRAVVVENKPGADGRIQLQQLARSAPDGYSLGLVDSGLAVNALLYAKPAYDPLKDFTPIIYLGEIPNFIAVTPSLKVNTLSEFIRYGKAHPGKLNYAATASSTLLAGEMLKSTAGLNIVRVPYKGAAGGIHALLSGEVQVMVSAVGTLAPLVKQGKVKALAVTAPKRTPLAPEVPTTAEAGLPAMVYVNWYCIVGPAGMPRPVVDRLNADLRKVLAEPKVAAQLRNLGIEPTPTSPEEFAAILKREMTKIGKIVASAKLKIE